MIGEMVALYSATLFLSAFLLFAIQPLTGKLLLPLLGGTPAIWIVCMLFFQVAVLVGYLYAHGSVALLKPRVQVMVQLVLLCGATVFLLEASLDPVHGFVPPVSSPTPALLALLTRFIGLPLLMLASTSSMVQSWFAATRHGKAQDPYFLYAAGNAGSLAGLLGYPLVVEPLLTLSHQFQWWRTGCVVLAFLIFACALIPWRGSVSSAHRDTRRGPRAAAVPTTARRLQWIFWALVPCSLVMGVTTYLTTDIIATPLLWVVPLALYILSFIVAFSARIRHWLRIYSEFERILAFFTVLCLFGILGSNEPIALFLPLNLATLFLGCTVCHGRLADDRPPTAGLTEFYFWIALGGVLGGAINGLLAPVLFKDLTEYPVALFAACLARPGPVSGPLKDLRVFASHVAYALGVAAALALLWAVVTWIGSRHPLPERLVQLLVLGIPAVLAYRHVAQPRRYVLNLFALFLAATSVFGFWGAEPLARTRTFFGTLKVVRTVDGQYVQLIHGTTLHGAQPSDPARRNEPVTYYARSGPLGQIFDLLHRPGARPPRKVAVVGLGTGSTIAYARPGEDWVFYELDPGILALAQNEKYFTYLRGRDASSTHFVIGDARLRLAEAPDAAYDLIVMDAFTSDAIPAHLLTHEALELYWKKLSPGGWLAFNVSNRYLDLSRLLAALAEATGAVAEMRSDLKVPEGPESHGVSASVWVVLSRDSTLPRLLQGDSRWTRPQRGSMRLWTDDYSNLLSVLR